LADKEQEVEARRLEIIRAKYESSNLNSKAKDILLNKRLIDNATNRSYKPGQRLFLLWASEHQVSETDFNSSDLINFLADMFTEKGYSVGTIQLCRTAVTHLNNNPKRLRENSEVNDFITTLLNQAPPIRTHKLTIDLKPTFQYLMSICPDTTTLARLQSKLAFLLAVTCFLRPSDLVRIPLSSIQVSSNSTTLTFEVHCPKEKRARRKIIKSFQVKAHKEPTICPVNTCNSFLQKRPTCSATSLFVNSKQPNKTLSVRTVQAWLTKLLRMSTDEKGVSIRSIASSLALKSGIPKEDIITLGNWVSSSTFENHYRREHLSDYDFTNTLITELDMDSDGSKEEFFDAEDNLN
jgi:hypothetical protein